MEFFNLMLNPIIAMAEFRYWFFIPKWPAISYFHYFIKQKEESLRFLDLIATVFSFIVFL